MGKLLILVVSKLLGLISRSSSYSKIESDILKSWELSRTVKSV